MMEIGGDGYGNGLDLSDQVPIIQIIIGAVLIGYRLCPLLVAVAYPHKRHIRMLVVYPGVERPEKPYTDDPETTAAYQPVLRALLSDTKPEGDPQLSENMLQVQDKEGIYSNQAAARGLDATGWSWSSKFGDLDQDGALDLYVVNGMIELTTLGHLANHELVEENQVLTIEPGLYVAQDCKGVAKKWHGIGIRIEDDVLVTKDGCEVLSKDAPKTVDEIETVMKS